MLAKKLTLQEAERYNNDVIDKRPAFKEKIVQGSTTTCYSVDKATFDPRTMVQILMLSSEDHKIDF